MRRILILLSCALVSLRGSQGAATTAPSSKFDLWGYENIFIRVDLSMSLGFVFIIFFLIFFLRKKKLVIRLNP